ncbi:abortive infection family protein [Mycobacterium marinum]|nr:abortive infection family protein [Mycobacterium marinum]MDC8993691.1 abortive infection family protein [Mycobacterium marinum]WDZ14570.1 abortive infection family protein [Mycobacterium marinum]
MSRPPVSEDIAATFARFYLGGNGSTHAKLTAAFVGSGFGDAAPYDEVTHTPNKEIRVRRAIQAAVRRPARARQLIDSLLRDLRAGGHFDDDSIPADALSRARRAFRKQGWILSDVGDLSEVSINLDTGGRPALNEQLHRLQQANEDPALALGSAKDLLEAVAKFVLSELDWPIGKNADFGELWYFARERLNILPQQVAGDTPGANHIKAVLQSGWAIAEQVNSLRNLQGTGHGRTLPTGVTAELARLVVREACSVAEFTLSSLDRAKGQS